MSELGYIENANEITLINSEEVKTSQLSLENNIDEKIILDIPSSVTEHTLTLPSADSAGSLTSDGAGNLSWSAAAGGTTPDPLNTYTNYVDAANNWSFGAFTEATDLRIEQIGDMVHLVKSRITSTINSNLSNNSPSFVIPAQFRPTRDIRVALPVTDNTAKLGSVVITAATGLVEVFTAISGSTPFGATGFRGTPHISLSWNVNA